MEIYVWAVSWQQEWADLVSLPLHLRCTHCSLPVAQGYYRKPKKEKKISLFQNTCELWVLLILVSRCKKQKPEEKKNGSPENQNRFTKCKKCKIVTANYFLSTRIVRLAFDLVLVCPVWHNREECDYLAVNRYSRYSIASQKNHTRLSNQSVNNSLFQLVLPSRNIDLLYLHICILP